MRGSTMRVISVTSGWRRAFFQGEREFRLTFPQNVYNKTSLEEAVMTS